ncbi:cold-shock protein [Maridesulfovibrio sp.]|uniref:cold-shock protein n=1 Tax=Maridesulfovibrio sp. TaxID=2795000 RepID=UPI0039F149F0
MEGNIKSFLETKGYGFINGNDNKSYFFHISDVLSSEEKIEEGSFVNFDETATPKGYKALKVKILSSSNYYEQPIDKFYWSRKPIPSKYIILHSGQLEFADENLDNAREELEETALNLGFNAVVNVKYYTTTGCSGNYRYSIHHFRGDCCLLATKVACKDPNRIQKQEKENLAAISEINSKFEYYQKSKHEEQLKKQKSKLIKKITIAAIFLPFVVYVALGLWNTYQEELAIKERIEQHQKK